ncbi:MAG: hypothetical protein ACLUI2_10020 [Christensenellales bacterium]|jgi:hypothetical protein
MVRTVTAFQQPCIDFRTKDCHHPFCPLHPDSIFAKSFGKSVQGIEPALPQSLTGCGNVFLPLHQFNGRTAAEEKQ